MNENPVLTQADEWGMPTQVLNDFEKGWATPGAAKQALELAIAQRDEQLQKRVAGGDFDYRVFQLRHDALQELQSLLPGEGSIVDRVRRLIYGPGDYLNALAILESAGGYIGDQFRDDMTVDEAQNNLDARSLLLRFRIGMHNEMARLFPGVNALPITEADVDAAMKNAEAAR